MIVQNTQVDSILPVLKENKSKNIIFVVNTALGYENWVKAVGEERLMIAFPSAGGERQGNVISYFIGSKLQRCFQTTTFGEYDGKKSERVKKITKLFNNAGIPSVFCNNMDAWQKTHVALITCIGNALYGYNCNNYKFSKNYNSVKEMVIAIKEGRKVIKANNIALTPKKLWWFNLPTHVLTAMFSLFMNTKLAETTMAKHCSVAKEEMINLQKEFDILIKQSKLTTPMIEKLKKNL